MKLIVPLTVTDAKLTSSSVPETDYAEWNAGTAYSVGNRVIRASRHEVFERLIAGTTATAPESDTTNWVLVGSTNRWKMFDQRGNSITSYASPIVVTITPGQVVNSIAFLGLTATSVRVKVTDTIDGIVYDVTKNLTSYSGVVDWYTYFFSLITKDSVVLFTDLPSYGSATIEITITNTLGNSECGSCVLGQIREIGGVQYGASVGIQNYSIKQRDSFGNVNIVPRSSANRARYVVRFRPELVDSAMAILTPLKDIATVFIGSEDFDATVVYGYYKDFDIIISSFAYADCSIEIEGLV